MKIYLILHESSGEGDKWGVDGMIGRANERRGVIRSQHFWGGIRSKERIE